MAGGPLSKVLLSYILGSRTPKGTSSTNMTQPVSKRTTQIGIHKIITPARASFISMPKTAITLTATSS